MQSNPGDQKRNETKSAHPKETKRSKMWNSTYVRICQASCMYLFLHAKQYALHAFKHLIKCVCMRRNWS